MRVSQLRETHWEGNTWLARMTQTGALYGNEATRQGEQSANAYCCFQQPKPLVSAQLVLLQLCRVGLLWHPTQTQALQYRRMGNWKNAPISSVVYLSTSGGVAGVPPVLLTCSSSSPPTPSVWRKAHCVAITPDAPASCIGWRGHSSIRELSVHAQMTSHVRVSMPAIYLVKHKHGLLSQAGFPPQLCRHKLSKKTQPQPVPKPLLCPVLKRDTYMQCTAYHC